MDYGGKFFVKFNFSSEQIEKNLAAAKKDLKIAERVDILDVKFNYAYSALIKGGIALLSYFQLKVRSIPGHQAKIIEKIAHILKRNIDFYCGGTEVTEKECAEFQGFVSQVLEKIENEIRQSRKP